jgi:hypothetical protein
MSSYEDRMAEDRAWMEEQDSMFNYDFDNPPTYRNADGDLVVVSYDPIGPQLDGRRLRREYPEETAAIDRYFAKKIAVGHRRRILETIGKDLGWTTDEVVVASRFCSSSYVHGFIRELMDDGLVVRSGRVLELTATGREELANVPR